MPVKNIEGIMGKTAKKIKYIDGNLPERLGELLAKADESDLKILIALMMAADENGVVDESFSVSSALGLERTEVAAAVKFWRGAGFIETAGATDKAPKADTAKKPDIHAKKEDNKRRVERLPPLTEMAHWKRPTIWTDIGVLSLPIFLSSDRCRTSLSRKRREYSERPLTPTIRE